MIFLNDLNFNILQILQNHIIVEHRNEFPIMTSDKIAVKDGVIRYDFRKNDSYIELLGNGPKEIQPGVFTMYAENILQKDLTSRVNIDSGDLSAVLLNYGLNSTYLFGDVNMDGDVNAVDRKFLLMNNGVNSDVHFEKGSQQ